MCAVINHVTNAPVLGGKLTINSAVFHLITHSSMDRLHFGSHFTLDMCISCICTFPFESHAKCHRIYRNGAANQSIDRRITATDYIIKIQSKKWHTKFSSNFREQAFEQKNKTKNMNTADN